MDGHDLYAHLGGALGEAAQHTFAVALLVVILALVVIFLALGEHGVDQRASLWAANIAFNPDGFAAGNLGVGQSCQRCSTMKPEIIGSIRSSYTRVVCMVCEEKGIDYVLSETPIGAPALLAIHPFGKMPVLRHGDFELCESKAIATYLDRVFPVPQLIPPDPRLAALTEQWVSLVNSVVDGTMIRTYLFAYIFPKAPGGKPDQATIDAVMPALRRQFEVLDKAVAKTGHLVGDQYTLADINLMPILFYVRGLPEARELFDASANLTGYYAHHSARPSFQRTIPPLAPPTRATER